MIVLTIQQLKNIKTSFIRSDSIYVRRIMSQPLTKAVIVESVHNRLRIPRKECTEIIETLLEIIKSTLESGEDVLISGFGKFNVKDKNERKGRNPAKNEVMVLPARRVVTFNCSGHLRDKVNGG